MISLALFSIGLQAARGTKQGNFMAILPVVKASCVRPQTGASLYEDATRGFPERRIPLAATLAVVTSGPVLAQAQPPLRCAVDRTFAPHAFPSLQGAVQGFQIGLLREVARRMGREIVIDSASFSGLIPAMNSGR